MTGSLATTAGEKATTSVEKATIGLWTTRVVVGDGNRIVVMGGALDPDTFFDLFLDDLRPPDEGVRVRLRPAAAWRAWWMATAALDSLPHRASSTGFVLTGAELVRLGYSRSQIRTAIRHERWQMAGRGFVAPVDVTRDLSGSGGSFVIARRRHALLAAGASRARPRDVVATRSAAILHGLPTMRVPAQAELIVSGEVGAGRQKSHHLYTARCPANHTTRWFGQPLTRVDRTLVDVGRHDRFDAIMAADAALREHLVTRADIDASLVAAVGWPGIRQARDVLELADPRSESPLESVTRLRIHDDGLPAPTPQVQIGPYRVDLCWPHHGVVLECDGRVKYTADERWAEKRREQVIRRLGYRVERVVWDDVLGGWAQTALLLRSILC